MSTAAEPTLPELQQLAAAAGRLADLVGACSFTGYPKDLAAGIAIEAAHLARLHRHLDAAAAQLASHLEEARLDRLDEQQRDMADDRDWERAS